VVAPEHQPKTRALKRRQATRRGRSNRPARTLRIRVTLAYTDPPIERRLDLASDLRLDQVHRILQAAFDWNDSHLHEFTQGEQRWDDGSSGSFGPDPFDTMPAPKPERKTRLGQVLAEVGDELEYTYDFGDSWLHILTVEEVLPREAGAPKAMLLSAQQAAPPDDCGGIPGYYELLDARADPDDPDRADLVEWAAEVFGGSLADFDPAYVDIELINRRVQAAAG
jgi:hypothetical protein